MDISTQLYYFPGQFSKLVRFALEFTTCGTFISLRFILKFLSWLWFMLQTIFATALAASKITTSFISGQK